MNISNASASASLGRNAAVTMSDIIPLGLSAIAVTGNNWSINLTMTTGPALLNAIYTGPAVAAGATFPPLEITGVLTSDAIPSFTDTAAVSDNLQPTSMLTTFSVSVSAPNQMVTPVPTATVASSAPQLYITNSLAGSGPYFVGQTINYSLAVGNLASGAAENQPIIVHDTFSAGLTNIVATGSNWTITLDKTSSPALMTATYKGTYPVAGGAILPVISIRGTLTPAAVPFFTSNAAVSSADNVTPAVSPSNGAGPLLDTSVNTITVQAAPLAGTPTVTVTPGAAPDLSIVKVNLGGDHFKVGDKVTYVIIVSNPFVDGVVTSPITVSDIIPLGLSNVEVKAPLWNTLVSYDTSPTVITANYNGDLPIAPGETLSPITITGTLNANAVPSLTDTATVDTLNNIGDNNTSTDTVFVDPSDHPHGQHHNSDHDGCDCSNGDNDHNGDNGSNGHNGSDGSDGSSGSSYSPALPDTGGAAI